MNTRHLFFVLVLLGLIATSPLASRAQSIPNNLTPTNDTGVQPYQTYGGVRENINLMNGNVNLQVPLLTLPGRNGHDLAINLNYDSKIWQLRHQYIPDPAQDLLWWEYEVNVPRIGDAGWRLGVPLLQATLRNMTSSDVRCYTDFVITLSDGSKHVFRNRAACFRVYNPSPPPPPQGGSCPTGTVLQQPSQNVPVTTSQDAAFLLLDTTNPADVVLHLKDGTRIHFSTLFGQDTTCIAYPYLKIANTIVDTDGNIITIQSSDDLENARVDSLTDTLGRTVTFTYGANTTITYKDSSGSPATITLAYGNFSNVAPTFSQPLAEVMQPYPTGLLASITLPNNLQYMFTYNNWAELEKITYPTGGYTRYDYGAFVSWWVYRNEYGVTEYSIAGDFREVTARRVCSSASGSCGNEEKTTTYTPTITSAQEHNQFMDLCDPEQNRSRSEFVDKREVTRWVYQAGCSNGQPVGGTVLRTTQTEYIAAGSLSFTNGYDKIPSRITTTLNDSGQVSKVEYDYDSWSYGTVIDNPIEVREYDYGGALVRKTVNTWLKVNPVNSQNYWSAAIYVVDRKASEIIKTGSGSIVGRTDFEYDNYTEAITASSAVQHESSFGTSYTTRGNLTAVTRYTNAAAGSGPVTTRNQYDDAGNTRKTTDPGGHATTFVYTDSWYQATCAPGAGKAYVTSTTNPLGHVTTSTYNSCSGTARSTTDPNNQTTTFAVYDEMGRLRQTDLPDTGQLLTTYNEGTTPLNVTRTTKISSGMNAVAPTDVDGLGWVTQSRLTSDPEGTVYTDTTYDALGRKQTVSNPYRSTGDPTYGITRFCYDALGRVRTVTPPDGTPPDVNCEAGSNLVRTVYNGNCTTVTDQAGKQRKSCTDALGRLIQVYEPDSNGVLNQLTSYTYDVLDNLLTVVQSGSRQRTFVYDSLSQLTSATNPESGTITYTYDSDGNLFTKTAPKPNQTNPAVTVTTTYTYDALHRLLTKSYNDGSTATVRYGYDGIAPSGCTPPSLTFSNAVGRRTQMCDAAGGEAWSYDQMGRVVADKRTTNGVTVQTNYGYNQAGGVTQITYPFTGTQITYAYSAAGRPLSAIDGVGTNYASLAKYAPQGALCSVKNDATMTSTFRFNNRLQPERMHVTTTGAPATPCDTPTQTANILDFTYSFDTDPGAGVANNGNVGTIANNRSTGRSQTFAYDELNRIKTAQTQATTGSLCWGQVFSYDIWANLLTIGGATGYGACTQGSLSITVGTNNRINSGGYAYDAAGNMTTVAGVSGTLAYDAENRATSVAGVSYVYDGDGKRVKKSNGTLYWYGAGGDVLAETDLAGVFKREYIYFNGSRTARHDAGGNWYYFADHLGSARIMTWSNGAIVEESDYYPFGGERTVLDTTNPPYDNTRKFTGQERDGESGLDYFIARHYASNLGRFLQPDEFTGGPVDAFSANDPLPPGPLPYALITNPQSLNKYTYTFNNPLRYTDPTGHVTGAEIAGGIDKAVDTAVSSLKLSVLSSGDSAATAELKGKVIDFLGSAVKSEADMLRVGTNAAQVYDAAKEGDGLAAGAYAAEDGGRAGEIILTVVGAASGVLGMAASGDDGDDTSDGPGEDFSAAAKREIDERAGGKCEGEGCGRDVRPVQNKKGEPTPPDQLQRHHIKPKSQGGSGSPDNAKVLCPECHKKEHRSAPKE